MNKTTFNRHKTGANFTILNNSFLQDQNLSNKAVGLMARIMSLPENWQINIKGLATTFKCSKDQVTNILKELIEHGYVRRQLIRKGNLKSAYQYDISDTPIYLNIARNPAFQDTEIQDTENTSETPVNSDVPRNPDFQDTGFQDTGFQDVINTIETKNPSNKKTNNNYHEFFESDFNDIQHRFIESCVKKGIEENVAIDFMLKRPYLRKTDAEAVRTMQEIGYTHNEALKLILNDASKLAWFNWVAICKARKGKFNYDQMENDFKYKSFRALLKKRNITVLKKK